MNANKIEFICFEQEGTTFILSGKPLKLVDQYTNLGSNISSTESVVNIRMGKTWIVISRLSIIWNPDLSDRIKEDFFPSVVASVLLYGCTLAKRIDKKILRVVLNISGK